jgi:hypothetical protein
VAKSEKVDRELKRAEGERRWEEFGSLVGDRYVYGIFPAKREPTGGRGGTRRPRGWRGSFWLSDSDSVVLGQVRQRWNTHLWIGERQFRQGRESGNLVQIETDEVVAEISGRHYIGEATTVLALRGGPTVAYPVWGTAKNGSVMVAEDSAGHSLAYFRWIRETLGWSGEIVVPPASLGGDDLALILLYGGSLFPGYFKKPGA